MVHKVPLVDKYVNVFVVYIRPFTYICLTTHWWGSWGASIKMRRPNYEKQTKSLHKHVDRAVDERIFCVVFKLNRMFYY